MGRLTVKFKLGNKPPFSFEILMLVLTLASVVIAIMLYLPELEFSGNQISWIYALDSIFVGFLGVDFALRAMRSEKGAKIYVATHFYELPAMLPLVLFSAVENELLVGAAIRSLRLLRLIRLLRLANLFRSLNGLKRSGFIYFAIIFAATIIFGSIAIYAVEAGLENSSIQSYEDAIWFAITSATISGYGDVYPATTEGRVIAVVLIFLGLAMILGFLTSVGTMVMAAKDRVKAKEAKERIKQQIDDIEHLSSSELDALKDKIQELHKKSTT